MKYEIVEEKERMYYGVQKVIKISEITPTTFTDVWDETVAMSRNLDVYAEDPPIGLELYPPNFNETGQFTYAALVCVTSFEGLDMKYTKRLPAGKFIKFKTTFAGLKNRFIPKVYQYIEENNIPVAYGLDYEEYVRDFDADNPESTIYVCLRMK